MITRNICLLGILGILLTFTFTGQPLRSQVAPAKVKVAVYVQAEEKEIHKTIVESHIRSELRRLDDVEIVKYTSTFPKWEFLIEVHILELNNKRSGELTGMACISYRFYENVPIWNFHISRLIAI